MEGKKKHNGKSVREQKLIFRHRKCEIGQVSSTYREVITDVVDLFLGFLGNPRALPTFVRVFSILYLARLSLNSDGEEEVVVVVSPKQYLSKSLCL